MNDTKFYKCYNEGCGKEFTYSQSFIKHRNACDGVKSPKVELESPKPLESCTCYIHSVCMPHEGNGW